MIKKAEGDIQRILLDLHHVLQAARQRKYNLNKRIKNMPEKTVVRGAAQGDLLIVRIEKLPENLAPVVAEKGHLILAEGESTGHFHGFPHNRGAALFRDADPGNLYFTLSEPVGLVHHEHSTITFAPGNYRVIRQRTYHAGMARRVAD